MAYRSSRFGCISNVLVLLQTNTDVTASYRNISKSVKRYRSTILKKSFIFIINPSPPPHWFTYFPMNILRSGPFPRKSSGACLFLLGRLGLSSTVLFKRKQEGQTVILLCRLKLTPTQKQTFTFLSQSSGIPHFSSCSSSPRCSEYAVRENIVSAARQARLGDFKT